MVGIILAKESHSAMGLITNFVKVRLDGKIIDESLKPRQMIDLGWAPCIVTELRWQSDGRIVSKQFPEGVLAKLLPGKTSIALIETYDVNRAPLSAMSVIESTGDLLYSIPNLQVVMGKNLSGSFCWFEPSTDDTENCFSAVFQADIDGNLVQYKFDFDIASGKIQKISASR
ncbi:hypothetical protein [Undibacterium sp. Dicai25W]|uniref:hypothetical protein n=1 Tax=Undibacterium sp. Dicai25W TaxID=3413034 RepID=UPI003BF59595